MLPVDLNERRAFLVGESLFCGLLGKILYEELEQEWLQGLIAQDVFAETPFGVEQAEIQAGLLLLQQWTAENRAGISDAGMKALEHDRLHLFIGIDQILAPLWESVYFSERHMVFQEQTIQVREWYARFGMQSERLHREPDDHIGLELSFVAHLASAAARAIEAGDNAGADALLQAQRGFLSEHLLRWGPAWAKLVKKHAETDFYRGLGHLTHGALLSLAEGLEIEPGKKVAA